MGEALQDIKATFAKVLKEQQKKFYPGMTNAKIAELLGVKERTYKGWREGTALPDSYVDLLALSKKMRCSVDCLLTGEEAQSGDDYIAQQTGLSPEAIGVIQTKLPSQDVLNERMALFEERRNKLLELQTVLYDDIPKAKKRMDESPEEIDNRVENELMQLRISLRPGLTDQELADEIGRVYPDHYMKEKTKEEKKEKIQYKDGTKEPQIVTVVPTRGFIRPGLLPKVKRLYQEYCDLNRRFMELRTIIKDEDPFLDTIDRIIHSEQLVRDIGRYLNGTTIRSFMIDDADTTMEPMRFDNDKVSGRYNPETGAACLAVLDGQSHTVKINGDFVVDDAVIRHLLIDRIRDDLDAMVRGDSSDPN